MILFAILLDYPGSTEARARILSMKLFVHSLEVIAKDISLDLTQAITACQRMLDLARRVVDEAEDTQSLMVTSASASKALVRTSRA